MENNQIFVSELGTSRHIFNRYHFCRGNSNKRKSRLGIILKGSGTYIYLSKRLKVSEGDVVLIPENIYCYSEWHGDPEIEVVYLSCFMHYESFKYEPQIIDLDKEEKNGILQISDLLSGGQLDALEAYSRFYRLLKSVFVKMKPSDISFDKTLQAAIEYITENWDKSFSVSELAKRCCVSESTLYHLFQSELGQTPLKFLNSIRINIAIEYLENSNHSISTVSRAVGFNSENHFRKVFSELTGTTPLKYRKNR
jgi:AraC-like DNA-binding protein